MSKIKIYRYSHTGFESYLQDHLIKDSAVILDDLLKLVNNEYLKNLIKKGFTEPDRDFEYNGIFVFLLPPSIKDRNYFLNHLKIDPATIPLHIAEIDSNAIGYHDNGKVYDKNNKMTVKDAYDRNMNTFYLPKSQLHLISQLSLQSKNKNKIN